MPEFSLTMFLVKCRQTVDYNFKVEKVKKEKEKLADTSVTMFLSPVGYKTNLMCILVMHFNAVQFGKMRQRKLQIFR